LELLQLFLLFYLLTGIISGLTFGMAEILAGGAPSTVIGASGAIGGLLAAYLLLHPRARVLVLVAMRFPVFAPSWIFIAIYVAIDVGMALVGELMLVRLFKYRAVPLFAPAEHYPETPFPELERAVDGRLRRLRTFGKQGPRNPLSNKAAIIVAIIKVISYVSLLLYLMLIF